MLVNNPGEINKVRTVACPLYSRKLLKYTTGFFFLYNLYRFYIQNKITHYYISVLHFYYNDINR